MAVSIYPITYPHPSLNDSAYPGIYFSIILLTSPLSSPQSEDVKPGQETIQISIKEGVSAAARSIESAEMIAPPPRRCG